MCPACPEDQQRAEHSTAYYFIEGLNELGTSTCSAISAPITRRPSRRWRSGRRPARRNSDVLLCPHENTAAHMAMGYAAVTGRGQAVLVHVDVGTANNRGMRCTTFFRSRLPVLLMSGKAPYTSSNELVARATPMCTSCRSRSTRARWCGPI